MALMRASRAAYAALHAAHGVRKPRCQLLYAAHTLLSVRPGVCSRRLHSTRAPRAAVQIGTPAGAGKAVANDGATDMVSAESVVITPRDTDYSAWYRDVIAAAEMVDHAPVRGCMVLRPHGYAVWEAIKTHLDGMIKATGHVNAYFPLLIPQVHGSR